MLRSNSSTLPSYIWIALLGVAWLDDSRQRRRKQIGVWVLDWSVEVAASIFPFHSFSVLFGEMNISQSTMKMSELRGKMKNSHCANYEIMHEEKKYDKNKKLRRNVV